MPRPKDENAALAEKVLAWRELASVAIRDGENWNDRRLPEIGHALNDVLDDLLARLAEAEKDAAAVRVKMHHNAANLDVAIEQRMAAEAERDHWHDEYLACCKSLTKRVHQGAEAVRERDRLRGALERIARSTTELGGPHTRRECQQIARAVLRAVDERDAEPAAAEGEHG